MWPYYLRNKEILKKLETEGHIEALASGIVYRKDEIDRSHYPAFHQIDGLYVCKKSKKIITQKDLEEVQIDLQGLCGAKNKSGCPGPEGCPVPKDHGRQSDETAPVGHERLEGGNGFECEIPAA